MEFTSKSRLLAAIKGEETDRVPFSPFLAYYFDFLPLSVRQRGELTYLTEMGADPLLRGSVQSYNVDYKEVELTGYIKGNTKIETLSFNKSVLTSVYTYSKVANSWFLSKHPVETLEDLKQFIEMISRVEITPEIERVNKSVRDLGESGLHLAVLGMDMKSSFQSLLEKWVGTENLVYFCMDYPNEINELLRIMRVLNLKTAEYTASSEAAACISFEDSSTNNISPSMYREYIMPEISEWRALLTQAGKPLIQHACGHIKDLLPLMAEQNIAAIESISPPPTGNTEILEACTILPKNISLIGGIEATQFLSNTVDQLLEYTADILDATKGRGFILSNSDSCPPGVEYKKFLELAKYIKNYKRYRCDS